jgi:hypothetical protein
MILADRHGNTLTLEPPPSGGDHAVLLTVVEEAEGDEVMPKATFSLRPDGAIALGSALVEWARDRMRAGGLF